MDAWWQRGRRIGLKLGVYLPSLVVLQGAV
jgi:hypothetical protein